MKYSNVLVISFLIMSCAHVDPADPLKNTKKLAAEGHRTLYDNGAFQIPSTKIKLIPEGPNALQLAGEFLPSARNSFLLALRDAGESAVIVRDGTVKSFGVAGQISHETNSITGKAFRAGHRSAVVIIDRSLARGKDFAKSSWSWPASINREMERLAADLAKASGTNAKSWSASFRDATRETKESWLEQAARSGREANESAIAHKDEAIRQFVEGYVVFPASASASLARIGADESLANFSKSLDDANARRARRSTDLNLVVHGVVQDFHEGTTSSFAKARAEFGASSEQVGYTLASLRALGWTLQGLVWDGALKPAVSLTSAAVGYLIVNGIAYPAELTVQEGVNVGRVLVQVAHTTGEIGYELTAPTVASAYSVVLAGTSWTAGKVAQGATVPAAYAIGATGAVSAPVVATGTQAAGQVGSIAIQYVAAGVADVGAVTTGTIGGVVIGGAGLVSGAAIEIAGATAGTGTFVAGQSVAASTAVVGTAGSIALGAANTGYQVAKGVAVPTTQAVTGGLVLSYGLAAQLSAQTILGAADAAYLVLSMEGPSYVVYAVQGKTGAGRDLRAGSVIDLEAARKRGEALKKLPVSDEEMKRLLKELGRETAQPSLPERP